MYDSGWGFSLLLLPLLLPTKREGSLANTLSSMAVALTGTESVSVSVSVSVVESGRGVLVEVKVEGEGVEIVVAGVEVTPTSVAFT